MTRGESTRAMLGESGAVPVVADALGPGPFVEAVGWARPDAIVDRLNAIGAVDPHFDRDFAPNAEARREFGWQPRCPSWRRGL